MPKRDERDAVQDMAEACARITAYAAGLSYESFVRDTKTQDAIVRNLEIIGEAAKNLTPAFKAQHDTIDWTSITRMRDKLIHHYFGINVEIVWDIVQHNIPRLREQLNDLAGVISLHSGGRATARPNGISR